nr:unnamed protein product [Digitaria exilis]
MASPSTAFIPRAGLPVLRATPLFRVIASTSGAGSKKKGKKPKSGSRRAGEDKDSKALEPPPPVVRRAPAGSASIFQQQKQQQQAAASKAGGAGGKGPTEEELRLAIYSTCTYHGVSPCGKMQSFLPEEYDKFFVKYLYPSFTPTVVLFLAGTVGYGVLKYFESEKSKS